MLEPGDLVIVVVQGSAYSEYNHKYMFVPMNSHGIIIKIWPNDDVLVLTKTQTAAYNNKKEAKIDLVRVYTKYCHKINCA